MDHFENKFAQAISLGRHFAKAVDAYNLNSRVAKLKGILTSAKITMHSLLLLVGENRTSILENRKAIDELRDDLDCEHLRRRYGEDS